MKLPNIFSKPEGERTNRLAFKGGSYSLVLTAVVLAIVIVVNLFASALPTTLTKLDMSSTKLYSITSNTKVEVNALKEDLTIYWIVQSGEEDPIIENLLGKYDSLSGHVDVVKKNPDVYPTFAEKYTDETIQNNSLVVECGDRSRYIAYDEIYLQETDMYSYSYTTSFDGEGAITSAIDYVTTEDLLQLYVLEGHGEAELPATFQDQIEKENIEMNTLSLLTVDEIPEGADALMIYAPSTDLSEEEAGMLIDYVADGGKLLVVSGPSEEGMLTNLNSILLEYGVEVTEGVVVEEDRNYYALGYPYVLMPEINSHAITDSLLEENYYALLPIAGGLKVTGETDNGTVTELLTTSDTSFSKIAGYDIETYEKEDGDIDGAFSAAVAIEDYSGGQLVWFGSSLFMEDMYNAYSSGGNVDMGMNAVSSLVGEREAIAIRSKSLNYNYLTINESTSSTLQIWMIGVLPLAYLGIGIVVVIRRRRMQNEQK